MAISVAKKVEVMTSARTLIFLFGFAYAVFLLSLLDRLCRLCTRILNSVLIDQMIFGVFLVFAFFGAAAIFRSILGEYVFCYPSYAVGFVCGVFCKQIYSKL